MATTLDDLPIPVTREEMYLDAIARNGGGGGGGSNTLSGLTDVDISNPTDGQTLVYNATAQKWENGAGGGGVMVMHMVIPPEEAPRLDKTWQDIDTAFNSGVILVVPHTVVEGTSDITKLQFTVRAVMTDSETYYRVVIRQENEEFTLECSSPNDYPAIVDI